MDMLYIALSGNNCNIALKQSDIIWSEIIGHVLALWSRLWMPNSCFAQARFRGIFGFRRTAPNPTTYSASNRKWRGPSWWPLRHVVQWVRCEWVTTKAHREGFLKLQRKISRFAKRPVGSCGPCKSSRIYPFGRVILPEHLEFIRQCPWKWITRHI